MISAGDLFDLTTYEFAALFQQEEPVWMSLTRLEAFLTAFFEQKKQSQPRMIMGEGASVHTSAVIEGWAYIGAHVVIEPDVYIKGPVIIGADSYLRHGAYIRGNVITGERCIIGHASELKHSILLDDVHTPHFAYVGNSILGNRVTLGAGVRLANWPFQKMGALSKKVIRLRINEQIIDTGLHKLGAILGDDVALGCNVVTNPGCIVAPRTVVYPSTALRPGYYPGDSIIKLRPPTEIVSRVETPGLDRGLDIADE